MYIPAPQMTLKVNLAQMLPIFRWINYKNKKAWYKLCIYYPRCSKFVLWRKKIVAKFLHNRMILSSRILSLFRFTSAFRCFLKTHLYVSHLDMRCYIDDTPRPCKVLNQHQKSYLKDEAPRNGKPLYAPNECWKESAWNCFSSLQLVKKALFWKIPSCRIVTLNWIRIRIE